MPKTAYLALPHDPMRGLNIPGMTLDPNWEYREVCAFSLKDPATDPVTKKPTCPKLIQWRFLKNGIPEHPEPDPHETCDIPEHQPVSPIPFA